MKRCGQKDQYNQECHTERTDYSIITVNQRGAQFKFPFDFSRHQDHNAKDSQQLIRHPIAIEKFPSLREYFTKDNEPRFDAFRPEEHPAKRNDHKRGPNGENDA